MVYSKLLSGRGRGAAPAAFWWVSRHILRLALAAGLAGCGVRLFEAGAGLRDGAYFEAGMLLNGTFPIVVGLYLLHRAATFCALQEDVCDVHSRPQSRTRHWP